MSSPEVDVDGVQRGCQRHPLALAVDGRLEGCRRWEAAKGLYWHLDGDGSSPRVLGSARAPCCGQEPRTPRGGPGGLAETSWCDLRAEARPLGGKRAGEARVLGLGEAGQRAPGGAGCWEQRKWGPGSPCSREGLSTQASFSSGSACTSGKWVPARTAQDDAWECTGEARGPQGQTRSPHTGQEGGRDSPSAGRTTCRQGSSRSLPPAQPPAPA